MNKILLILLVPILLTVALFSFAQTQGSGQNPNAGQVRYAAASEPTTFGSDAFFGQDPDTLRKNMLTPPQPQPKAPPASKTPLKGTPKGTEPPAQTQTVYPPQPAESNVTQPPEQPQPSYEPSQKPSDEYIRGY